MAVTIRKVKWMASHLRPTPMPSTKCPCVKDWDTGKICTEIMGINHCLPCAFAVEIHLDMKAQTGEVRCSGGTSVVKAGAGNDHCAGAINEK